METGVSVPMFSGVMRSLAKTFGNKPVPQEMFNRWIAALGDIEREYEALPMPEPKRKRKKQEAHP